MLTLIETLEQARQYRYNTWAGNPNGHPYIEGRCCESVWEKGRGALSYQCKRENGFGPEGLYCKQHDPAAIEEKRKKQSEKWDRELDIERTKWAFLACRADIISLLQELSERGNSKAKDILKEINE